MLAGYAALGLPPNIEYVDMPDNMRAGYQYFTQARMDRLLRAGYNGGFTSLEEAVRLYVTGFLNSGDPYR
jgi:ADP-L-glycero-D-manno-heptose 6-epimerase